MSEQPFVELLPQPLVALDGTVYRFRRTRGWNGGGGCPCAFEALCRNSVDAGGPCLCEEPIEPEMTGEGWAEGRNDS